MMANLIFPILFKLCNSLVHMTVESLDPISIMNLWFLYVYQQDKFLIIKHMHISNACNTEFCMLCDSYILITDFTHTPFVTSYIHLFRAHMIVLLCINSHATLMMNDY